MSWLDELKPGDKVSLSGHRWHNTNRYSFPTVDRVTKTQIIIGTKRYRKSNGSLVGDTSRFNREYIWEYNEKWYQDEMLERKRDLVTRMFDNVDFRSLSEDSLDRLKIVLEEIANGQTKPEDQ